MPISELLPQVILDEPIWKDMFASMDEIVGDTADSRIRVLLNRHNLEYFTNMADGEPDIDGPRLYEPSVKDDTPELLASIRSLAQLTGYSYQDAGKLDAATYLRMIEGATSYIPYKGTRKFIDFFSFVMNKNIVIQSLWYDYAGEVFYAENDPLLEGLRFDATGVSTKTAFPTPYVDIELDPEMLVVFTLQEIMDLFYSVTPFDVVIRDAIFGYNVEAESSYLRAGPRDVFAEITLAPTVLTFDKMPSILKAGDLGTVFKVAPGYVFTDVLGTTPATFGDGIGRINSLASSTVYAKQANVLYQPIYGRMPKVGKKNKVDYSEDFSNAYWTKNNLLVTVDVPALDDPFGNNNASLIAPSSVSGEHFLSGSNGLTLGAGTHNLSIYAQAADRSQIYIRSVVGATTHFLMVDLLTGAELSRSGYDSVLIENLFDNWFRISVTLTLTADHTCDDLFQVGVASLLNTTFTGDDTSGIYVFGAAIGNNLRDYQKCVGPYDITQLGVPNVHYLNFKGDGALVSNNTFNFGSVDKRTWFVGGTKFKTSIVTETWLRCNVEGGVRVQLYDTGGFARLNMIYYAAVNESINMITDYSMVNIVATVDASKYSLVVNEADTIGFGTIAPVFANGVVTIGSPASSGSTAGAVGHIHGWGWSNRDIDFAETRAVVDWLNGLKPDTIEIG